MTIPGVDLTRGDDTGYRESIAALKDYTKFGLERQERISVEQDFKALDANNRPSGEGDCAKSLATEFQKAFSEGYELISTVVREAAPIRARLLAQRDILDDIANGRSLQWPALETNDYGERMRIRAEQERLRAEQMEAQAKVRELTVEIKEFEAGINAAVEGAKFAMSKYIAAIQSAWEARCVIDIKKASDICAQNLNLLSQMLSDQLNLISPQQSVGRQESSALPGAQTTPRVWPISDSHATKTDNREEEYYEVARVH